MSSLQKQEPITAIVDKKARSHRKRNQNVGGYGFRLALRLAGTTTSYNLTAEFPLAGVEQAVDDKLP